MMSTPGYSSCRPDRRRSADIAFTHGRRRVLRGDHDSADIRPTSNDSRSDTECPTDRDDVSTFAAQHVGNPAHLYLASIESTSLFEE